MKELTSEEERVIVCKGTEPPFTGKYCNHHEDGTYTCRRCGQSLFQASDKFDSGCGWPSFEGAISGAIQELADADGIRVEIVCSKCAGHLGHVFRGEKLTLKDTRHCVNSISLEFTPTKTTGTIAIFAGGCFWGVEYHFQQVDGVQELRSGYIGGTVKSPSYEQVCSGDTGHFEAVEVTFAPDRVSYEELARLFFEIHDPTQEDGQGPDIGAQYLSAIFYCDDEQRTIAESLIEELRGKGYRIFTRLIPAGPFYEAEKYHQNYYARKGSEPYCHIRQKRF